MTTTPRRAALAAAAAACAAALLPAAALAQTTAPAGKPVRIIVPLTAGGAPDVLARSLAKALSEKTGQTYLIENRPGANTIIGTDACAKAAPDGTTLCVVTSSSVSINPHVYRKLPYDPAKDLEPVAMLAVPDMVLVAAPSLQLAGPGDMVAYARKHPGKLSFSSFGVGSDTHVTLEWLQRATRTELLHVPFNGFGPMLQAFGAGDIQLMYVSVGNPGIVAQIKSGKMTPLAVFAATRSAQLPEVPTLDELAPSLGVVPFQGYVWFGVMAPAGTPKALVGGLNADIVAAQRSPALREQFATMAMRARPSSAEAFADFTRRDREVWRELLKDGKIAIE